MASSNLTNPNTSLSSSAETPHNVTTKSSSTTNPLTSSNISTHKIILQMQSKIDDLKAEMSNVLDQNLHLQRQNEELQKALLNQANRPSVNPPTAPSSISDKELISMLKEIKKSKSVSTNDDAVQTFTEGLNPNSKKRSTGASPKESTCISTNSKNRKKEYELPPLPSKCPEQRCSGKLSVALGKRKNKALIGLSGPDYRWVVSCSQCAKKWHACHFNCGYISKIGTMGSSEIIRHEQGRYNKRLKKIAPPCENNPMKNSISFAFHQQKISATNAVLNKGKLNVTEIPNNLAVINSDLSNNENDRVCSDFTSETSDKTSEGSSCLKIRDEEVPYMKQTKFNEVFDDDDIAIEDIDVDVLCEGFKGCGVNELSEECLKKLIE